MDIYRPQVPPPQSAPARADGDQGRLARHPAPGESLHRLMNLVGELKEYLSYLLSAKADKTKATLRNAGLYAALGVVGLITAVAMIAVSVVLLLWGAAAGIGAALGGQMWVGALIIGAFVLACIGAGARLFVARMMRAMRAKTVKKYEQRQSWQRGRFGRDVEEAAKRQ